MIHPTVVITLGDPAGIGPEIVEKAFRKNPSLLKICRPFIVGREKELVPFYRYDEKVRTFEIPFGNGIEIKPGKVQGAAGEIALMTLRAALEILKSESAYSALVTAPVSKEAVMKSAPGFMGHTEFLARASGKKSDEVAMVMASEKKKALLVTRHIPLQKVPSSLTPGLIIKQVIAAAGALQPKKIFFCNLNPHCGEGGKIGSEEKTVISAAVAALKRRGMKVYGPLNAENAFAFAGAKDLIVCNYHDQAMLPLKLLCGMRLVNLTCGLPYVRTSPAHGTAFDIAGKDRADPASMIEAIKLAVSLRIRRGG